jgi:glycosyltransferase 2 family protein
MIQKNKDRLLKLIKSIISIIIILFIVRYIKANFSVLINLEYHINYFFLIISFIILSIFLFNQFILWYYITKQNGCNLSFSKSIISRAYSEFGKYVPGKIVGYAMLFYIYSKAKKSKILVSYSMFFELLASVLAALLIFLFSLFFTNIQALQNYRIAALILLLVFFVLIHPKILNYFVAICLKIAKREPLEISFSYYQLLRIVLLYVVNFMVLGVGFVLLVNSIYPLSISNILYVTGSTAMAGLIGLFAIFVPAGLGVREGILTLALKVIMPLTFAGVISLASRVWLVLGEILLFFLIFIYNLYLKKVTKKAIEYKSSYELDS